MSDALQGIIVAIICIAAIIVVLRKIFSKRGSGCSCERETGQCQKNYDCENPECKNCIYKSSQSHKK